ncbi:hypothetical protein JHK86_051557 [Glycine max]|nr:hypothetical protein JHK86_051557 [Glycine max]
METCSMDAMSHLLDTWIICTLDQLVFTIVMTSLVSEIGKMFIKYLSFCCSKHTSSSQRQYPTVIEELRHQFLLADLRKSTNNFDENQIVGSGALSIVILIH